MSRGWILVGVIVVFVLVGTFGVSKNDTWITWSSNRYRRPDADPSQNFDQKSGFADFLARPGSFVRKKQGDVAAVDGMPELPSSPYAGPIDFDLPSIVSLPPKQDPAPDALEDQTTSSEDPTTP